MRSDKTHAFIYKKGAAVLVEMTIPPRTINVLMVPKFEKTKWNVGEDVFVLIAWNGNFRKNFR